MKKVILFLSIGIILIGIPVTIFLVGKNQDIRKKAAPATTLSLSPSTTTMRAGDTTDLSVNIDTATNEVATIQLEISYDPTLFEASIKNGPLTPSILISGKTDATTGKVTIKVGAASSTAPITGTGTIAALTLKALAASPNPATIRISADPNTYVSALGEDGKNALVGTSPATVTILNADGTAASALTPTPTPIQSATVSGTLTPTLTPTEGASQSAEASSSAITITSITQNEQVDTQTPVISGKGVPGSTITIIIHSTNGQTATVTVDANGNWTYTPTTPLAPGDHTVEAMSTDPTTGATDTTTTNFVVASGTQNEGSATGSAIPATGNESVTVIFVAIGVLLFLSGALIPVFIK